MVALSPPAGKRCEDSFVLACLDTLAAITALSSTCKDTVSNVMSVRWEPTAPVHRPNELIDAECKAVDLERRLADVDLPSCPARGRRVGLAAEKRG